MMMKAFIWFTLGMAFLYVRAEVEWYDDDFTDLGQGEQNNRVMVYSHQIYGDRMGIRVICPPKYVLLPRNDEEDAIDPYVYVPVSRILRKVRISNVIQHLMGEKALVFHREPRENITVLQYPTAEMLVRREVEDMFILCASRDLWLNKTLSSEIWLAHLNKNGENQMLPTSKLSEMAVEMNIRLGIVGIDLLRLRHVTQGCGSMPINPFKTDIEYNESTGQRSCTIDILQHPHVGFYCDGIIEPRECFQELFDVQSGNIFSPIAPVAIEYHRGGGLFWVFGYYARNHAREFNGECRCIDAKTQMVTAKINIKTGGPSYVCDIRGKLMKNLVQPILGNWCDFALLPGSTLTIKLPAHTRTSYQDDTTLKSVVKSSDEPTSALIAFELSVNSVLMNYMNHGPHAPEGASIWEILQKSFPGNALQIDTSNQRYGEIHIHYMKNRPLDHRFIYQGRFTYDWNMETSDTMDIDNVHTKIHITPVQTHDYSIRGCEPPNSSIFYMISQTPNAAFKELKIGKHNMMACEYFSTRHLRLGLFCPHDQTLEPDNCESMGYNSSLQGVETWPPSIRITKNPLLENHRTFETHYTNSIRS